MQTYNLTDYPKDLQKKVTLLQHFRSYLENNKEGQGNIEDEQVQGKPKIGDPSAAAMGSPVYVKKWMRTKHAIMFRLSNKIVQVNFQDHTEILLNSESRLVTYVNKKGERQTLPLNHALESNNAEMTKRLKYTKDILTHMLNNNGTKGGASTAGAMMGGTGAPTMSSQSRQGTINTAVSSKRSMGLSGTGELPSSTLVRSGSSTTNVMMSSDRRPLNVINQAQ